MTGWLALAFIFFAGAHIGWDIELLWRHFISNKGKKWINPGFCVGPYLPLYGFGLLGLFLISYFANQVINENTIISNIIIIVLMGIIMTIIEYIAGIVCLRYFHVRLWDYSNEFGNIQGIICPLYSFFWGILGAVYYFFIHPYILGWVDWLAQNLAFSFFVGVFYGVFVIDVVYSGKILSKIKNYAKEKDVVVRFENLKAHILEFKEKRAERINFLYPFSSSKSIAEHLNDAKEKMNVITQIKKEFQSKKKQ